MADSRFTNREITLMFENIDAKLDDHAITHQQILKQVLYTNGKVKNITRWLLIIGSASGTLLVTNGPEVLTLLKIFI